MGFISHGSGDWKFKVRVPAGLWLGSGEDSLVGLQMAIFSLCSHMSEDEERGSQLSGVPSSEGTNPFMRAPASYPNFLPTNPISKHHYNED